MNREHAVAPVTVRELVEWAAPYCPAEIASAVVSGGVAQVRACSWLVSGGSLGVDGDGLSYRRRTVVEPRWAYSEWFTATWFDVGAELRTSMGPALRAAFVSALARHRILARGVDLSAQEAASVWAGPDSVVRAQTSTTADLRQVLARHARNVLAPLVMFAAHVEAPIHEAVRA